MNRYDKVSQAEFEAYLEHIRVMLKAKAPEWHINTQGTPPPKERVYYHLARHDFSAGKDKTWDIPISTWVFGYSAHVGDHKQEYYLLNLHPLQHKLT